MIHTPTKPRRLLNLGMSAALVVGAAEGCTGETSATETDEDNVAAAPAQQGGDNVRAEGTPLAAEPEFDRDAAGKNKRLRLDVVNCVGASAVQIAPGVYDIEVELDQPDARGVQVKVAVHEAGTEAGYMDGTSGRIAIPVGGQSLYDRANLTTFVPYGDGMWVKDECPPISVVDQG